MKVQKEPVALIFLILYVSAYAQFQIIPAALFVADVAQWAFNFWNYLKTGYHMILTFRESFRDTCPNDKKYTNALTSQVVQVIPQISTQLDEVAQVIRDRSNILEEMIKKLELEIDISVRMHALVQSMGVIDNLHKELSEKVPTTKQEEFVGQDFCNFAYRQVYGDPLSAKIDEMYNIIAPSQRLLPSLLVQISEDLESNSETLCGTGHSTLDYLHSIYTSLMLVEIRAYVMTAFSHNLLYNFNGTGFQCEYHWKSPEEAVKAAQKKLRQHLQVYDEEFLKQMKKVSREFRACDQENDFIRGATYFELEGAIQMIVQFPTGWDWAVKNEKERSSCDTINTHGTPTEYCNTKYKFCTTPMARNCRGITHNCHSVPYWITGCLSKKPPRRYEWVHWRDHKHYPMLPCPEESTMYLMDISSSFQPCYCECNDNDVDSISTHVFNLQWVESDVSRNMVITGVKFIVKHRVMQFQIQQGQLSSNFKVQNANWEPVNDISEEIRAARMKENLFGKPPGVVENEDFLVVTQALNNEINFDTLHVPHSHVLTGVRFKFLNASPNVAHSGRIEIAIKATKFNHITGELCKDCEPIIVTSKISHEKQYIYPKIRVNKPIFPTKPLTSPGQYVRIESSNWMEDAGQTTLPLFDALPLISIPSAPLGGIGIFHRGNGDFTGFVSLKFASLDYPAYMKKSGEDLEKIVNSLEISVKH